MDRIAQEMKQKFKARNDIKIDKEKDYKEENKENDVNKIETTAEMKQTTQGDKMQNDDKTEMKNSGEPVEDKHYIVEDIIKKKVKKKATT